MKTKENAAPSWYVYMLACCDDKIYTGISTNVEKRFLRHAAGRGAKFTKFNPPKRILAHKLCATRSEASKLEWAIKQLTRKQKLALVLDWKSVDAAVNS